MANQGNLRISELTHLSSLHGTERIPVSWKAPGSTTYESYSFSASELSSYIDTSFGITTRLNDMDTKVNNAYAYVGQLAYQVDTFAYQVDAIEDTVNGIDHAMEDIGGAEQLATYLETVANYVTYVNALEEKTAYMQEDINTLTYMQAMSDVRTMSGNMTNQECPVTLTNGQSVTVFYHNTSSAERTVSIATNKGYILPAGVDAIQLTVPVNRYCEVNYMKRGDKIFVRGL